MILIDKERCIGCGLCVKDCIAGNLKVENGKAEVLGSCLQCGHCVAVCAQNAVQIPEFDMADVTPCGETVEANALLSTIKGRRSIRNYQPKKIEREKLELLMEAGRYTATAKNTQGCRFVLVQDELDTFKDMIWNQIAKTVETGSLPELLAPALLESYKGFLALKAQGTDFLFRNAPAVLFVGAETPVDAGLAAQNIELMAVSQGLGALYNGFLNYTIHLAPELKQWLGLEDKVSYVCMLLGYPAVTYTSTAPRKAADVVWR